LYTYCYILPYLTRVLLASHIYRISIKVESFNPIVNSFLSTIVYFEVLEVVSRWVANLISRAGYKLILSFKLAEVSM